MSTIHHTTLRPSKLELLAQWMRAEPWYRGAMSPHLSIVGGFRLDDPDGEVGLEFLIVRDDPDGIVYLAPVSYRSAPLRDGESENHLIGTIEHGVLGTRYVYDGPADPVWRSAVAALLDGDAEPQHRSISDTPDRTVLLVAGTAAGEIGEDTVVRVLTEIDADAGDVTEPGVVVPWTAADDREVTGLVLRGVPA